MDYLFNYKIILKKRIYFWSKNSNTQSSYYVLKEFKILKYVHIIFKHINQVINFKESKFVICYVELFVMLKINCSYTN